MKRTLFIVLLLALAGPGCGDPKRDNYLDQKPCVIPCGDGEMCRGGACVRDPCPKGLMHIEKQEKSPTDFCITPLEAFKDNQVVGFQQGKMPWTNLYAWEAWAACRAANLTLCTASQWVDACKGVIGKNDRHNGPDAEACKSDSMNNTGVKPACEGGFTGLYDMLGNAAEWVSGKEGSDEFYSTSALAGGSHEDVSLACYQLQTDWTNKVKLAVSGFRCCAPCNVPGADCTAEKPEWFKYQVQEFNGSMYFTPSAIGMWGFSATDIWMIADRKVLRFKDGRWGFDTGWGDSNLTLVALTGDPDGGVWIGALDKKIFHRSKGGAPAEVNDAGLNLKKIRGLAAESSSAIYAAGDGDGSPSTYRWDGTTWTAVGTRTEMVNAIWYDRDKGIPWVVGPQQGIAWFDGKTWNTVSVGMAQAELRSIHGTDSESIWIAGHRENSGNPEGLLFKCQHTGKKCERVNLKVPAGNILTHVFALHSGRVWVSGPKVVVWGDVVGLTPKNTGFVQDIGGPLWAPANNKEHVWVGLVRRR